MHFALELAGGSASLGMSYGTLVITFGFRHWEARVGGTLFLLSFLFIFLPSDNFLSLIFILNIFSTFIENKIICCSSLCFLHIRVTFLVYS